MCRSCLCLQQRFGEDTLRDNVGERMQIFIITLHGTSVAFDVSGQMSIAELKVNVATRLGMPVVSFRLICAGKQLEDNRTVGFYAVSYTHLTLPTNREV